MHILSSHERNLLGAPFWGWSVNSQSEHPYGPYLGSRLGILSGPFTSLAQALNAEEMQGGEESGIFGAYTEPEYALPLRL